MKNFGLVNEAYDEVFTWDNKPVSFILESGIPVQSFRIGKVEVNVQAGKMLYSCERATSWDRC